MAKDIWFASDHHLGHEKCCTTFLRDDGTPLRPFANAEEMNEALIQRHNEVVKPQDKVYFLGDVAITQKNLPLVGFMHGSKRLIRGNHDIFPTKKYQEFFKEVYGVRVLTEFGGIVLTHVPIHPSQLRRFKVNVHGHLHDKVLEEPGYINVSVEQIDYRPIHIDEILAQAARFNPGYDFTQDIHPG
ncbi:hypothetical protein KIKIMORA_02390 [Brevundimonas phage vB_BpoS-Kikimora]|uniref:Metallo-dependent phosphatase-like protein n=2 Tax=Kikimoravirus TaxID=3425051 RepID=A0A9E7N4Y8_9CAUD|nr:hypothetical protein KIKIMORA_02390 [Brevundimonas phage vB_BpoS-Kikimora]UTC28276.1 metallo-dependent phosphatase-like protein [Brevundimonas phage vB_BpoS-Gurke]